VKEFQFPNDELWPARLVGPFPRLSVVALSPSTDSPGTHAGGIGRILIVEDEYFVALVSEDALSAAGFVVVGIAATAEEAIAAAGSEQPDVVLMDIRLAGQRDGIDAAAEIFERYGIPSVFATAQADAGTRARGENAASPLGWLLKPFAPDEVVAVVGAAIAATRRRKAGN
jgi:CheY-like chemotaxis protein